jgi:hypothetical protein
VSDTGTNWTAIVGIVGVGGMIATSLISLISNMLAKSKELTIEREREYRNRVVSAYESVLRTIRLPQDYSELGAAIANVKASHGLWLDPNIQIRLSCITALIHSDYPDIPDEESRKLSEKIDNQVVELSVLLRDRAAALFSQRPISKRKKKRSLQRLKQIAKDALIKDNIE